MKTIELILVIMCVSTVAWGMQTMTVTTGQGSISYNGQIIDFYSRPIGNYPLCDGLSYSEIPANQTMNTQQANGIVDQEFFNSIGCH